MDLKEERDFWRKRALELESKRDTVYLSGIPTKALEELKAKCEAQLAEWYNAAYLAYKEADMYNEEIWKILYDASFYEEDQIEFWKSRYNEATAMLKTRLLLHKIKKGPVRFNNSSKK